MEHSTNKKTQEISQNNLIINTIITKQHKQTNLAFITTRDKDTPPPNLPPSSFSITLITTLPYPHPHPPIKMPLTPFPLPNFLSSPFPSCFSLTLFSLVDSLPPPLLLPFPSSYICLLSFLPLPLPPHFSLSSLHTYHSPVSLSPIFFHLFCLLSSFTLSLLLPSVQTSFTSHSLPSLLLPPSDSHQCVPTLPSLSLRSLGPSHAK